MPQLEEFIRRALGVALASPLPSLPRAIVNFTGTTGGSVTETLKPNTLRALQASRSAIQDLGRDAIRAAVEACLEINRYFVFAGDTAPTNADGILESHLFSILEDYASRVDEHGLPGQTIDEAILTSVLAGVERDLSRTSVDYVTLAYLAHATVSAEHDFEGALSVRPATEVDLAKLITEIAPFSLSTMHSKMRARTIIREITPVLGPPMVPTILKDNIWLLVALLRVVSDGALPVVRARRFIDSPTFHNSFPTDPVFDFRSFGDDVDLETYIPQAKRLWPKVLGGLNSGTLDIMLRRFSYGGDRQRPEDALVDYVIGIESPIGSKAETTHKVALRLAAAIGESSDERKAIFKRMPEVYQVRSDVVHGRAADRKDILSASADARTYLRRLSLRIAEMDRKLDPKKLDEEIITGLGNRKSTDTN